MDGLPHNNINDIYLNNEGELFYATKTSGIFSLNSDKAYDIASKAELEFTCIAEDRDGNLWAGTYGNGIFKFASDSLIFLSTDNGLKSDYCYSITCDDSNNIWVGHHLGLSRISKSYNIKQYGPNDGFKGDCNPNTTWQNNKIYWGTTDGVICYEIDKEKGNKTPPITSIQEVYINNKRTFPGEDIHLKYGIYKVQFNFTGINFKAPKKLTYQYKLKGFEKEWSDVTRNNTVKYPRLEDGEYTFLLKACNEAGICIDEPVSIGLEIKKPFWKTWWFILLLAAALIFIIILIIKYRERKQRKFQKYLQDLLDERTAKVVQQNKELEKKNKSITESITYAKRIQSSMLPTISSFRKTFNDSFVYYNARDIVSGDFFWFRHLKDDKYIIICADCTGHGVPGSLVSMIGLTHIKDIINNKKVESPAKMLKILQGDFRDTLKQEYEETKSSTNDGMDISVCEVDIKKHTVRIASAMRPVLIKTKNELIRVKGTKVAIGGAKVMLNQDDTVYDFDLHEFQLQKDDVIYMFTDGYIDQFGGKDERKIMINRLRDNIEKVYTWPMNKQYDFFKTYFEEWKGDNSQIDDVLLMGIKL